MVVSVRESTQIVEELLRAGQPVGLDGEGVNLGPKGQLTLLQVMVMTMKMEMMRKILMIIVVLCSAPSVPQPVVQSRRRPLLGPSPG